MNKHIEKNEISNVFKAVLSLKNEQECQDFFDDLCTNKEVEQMAQRVCAAKLLMDGKTYNQVIEETDISSATLSRVSRCVQYGKGYSEILKRL